MLMSRAISRRGLQLIGVCPALAQQTGALQHRGGPLCEIHQELEVRLVEGALVFRVLKNQARRWLRPEPEAVRPSTTAPWLLEVLAPSLSACCSTSFARSSGCRVRSTIDVSPSPSGKLSVFSTRSPLARIRYADMSAVIGS